MEVPAIGNFLDRYISARYILVLLGFTGISIVQGLMMNLPMALLGKEYWESRIYRWSTDYGWTSEQEGITYSAYFSGYLLSTLLIGLSRITHTQFSPKWVMFFGVMINILCTLLTPVMVYIHYFAVALLRFNMGVGGGVTLPALNIMLSKWTLPADRSKMRSLVHTSTLLGFVISILFSGVFASEVSWESVFYIMGGVSLIWCLPWIVWAQDSPQQQPFISVEERNMIVTALEKDELESLHEDTPVPWREVLSSKPFLAILIAFLSCNWGVYMLLFQLPLYLKEEVRLPIVQVGATISMCLLGAWLFNIGLTKFLNWMQNRNVINTLTGRKIATTIATGVPAFLLFILCFTYSPTEDSIIALLFFLIVSTGGMFYGFYSNYYDIAPNFADKLMYVTDILVIIPRLLVPIFIAGFSAKDCKLCGMIFMLGLTLVLYLIAFIAYTVCGSVEEQPWNKVTEKNDSSKGHLLNA